MIYKMTLKDSVDTMTFNLLETPIVDKDIEGAVDNVTLDGNQYTDYLYLKKQYIQKWAIMCPDGYDQLRGFYTRQFEDGEVPSYRVYYGANVTRDYTLNGYYFQFNAEGIETGMTLSQLLGNATQSGTPTPDSPQPISTVTGAQTITVTGNNLFDGILENGSYYTTTSLTSRLYNTATIPLAVGEQYTVSLTGDSQNLFRFAVNMDSQPLYKSSQVGGSLDYDSGWKTGSFSFTATYPYMGLIVSRQDNGDLTPSDLSNCGLQLELGSTATAYEPYQGQSYEINLGKNLLDNKATTRTYLGVTLTKNDDGSITLNGKSTGSAQFYLNVDGVGFQGRTSHLDAGTYTINGRDSGGVKFEINYQTANGSSKYSWGTFTVAEPFNYGIYVNVTNGTTVNNLRIYPQLERGSQATTYAPYFTPIELAEIGTYQDRIYKNDGKWYIEKQIGKVVLDGSETWNTTGTQYYTSILQSVVAPTPNTSTLLGYSQYFLVQGFNYQSDTNLFFHPNKNLQVKNTNWATLSDWTTWLSTHPTTVYYALATPTTTEITDETLLYQLNFLASLYGGVNNISLVGTGAQGEMEVFIRDVMSVETDVVPEVPVRLTLTDDGVINACGCRRNVQLTMRETTE